MKCITGKEFHSKYKNLYEHSVVVELNNGEVIEGGYYDDFYEDRSILISVLGNNVKIIKICDIRKIELSPKD